MTAREAEQVWGLSSGTVRAALVRGIIQGRKSAGTWLVTRETMINHYGGDDLGMWSEIRMGNIVKVTDVEGKAQVSGYIVKIGHIDQTDTDFCDVIVPHSTEPAMTPLTFYYQASDWQANNGEFVLSKWVEEFPDHVWVKIR